MNRVNGGAANKAAGCSHVVFCLMTVDDLINDCNGSEFVNCIAAMRFLA